MHGGPQATLATLRLTHWIVKGRYCVKDIIKKCLVCRRYSKRTCQQLMGFLPSDRTNPSKPFQVGYAGVDYAGPIKVRLSKCRGPGTLKGYIAIFVCFATHAIHIEIVEDYSGESFVAAFHRFTARRGHCTDLYSDQGTTFVGADSELKALFEAIQNQSTKIYNDLRASNTNWHFNPPGAPHFGGLWEAAVKSAKYHLIRVIGEKVPTFVELSTVLCRIEAILNSRPLMALTDDVNDLEILTPAHFLISRPSFLVPEPDLTLEKIPLGNRCQLYSQMVQHFWDRWAGEYLTSLQERQKWFYPQKSLDVGDLVVIKDETCSPGKWPLAQITEVHPDSDKLVRAVTLRTATSTLDRPAVKIISLLSKDEL